MSNKKEFNQISQNEARQRSIKTLSDRPNKKAYYGEGGLTAKALKERFDALPELGIEKTNEIISVLSSGEFAKYIAINTASQDNLYDFLALFKEATEKGENIANYIKIYYDKFGGAETSLSLVQVVNDLYSIFK